MVDHQIPTPNAKPSGGEDWKRLTNSLPAPPRPEDRDDLLWQELTAHFRWYDKAATRSRLAYQVLKMAALIAGAAVTVLAAVSAPPVLTASLAGLVVVMEGAQQLYQCHRNWLTYRATAETLRHHAFLYVADVMPYDDPATRRDLLAAFIKDLTANENNQWAAAMRQSDGSATR
jgi:hypothetical protein